MLIDVSKPPRRVAVLSMHTSPLDQPGTGDAGGLNVYVVETSKRLAEQGVLVDIYTWATRAGLAHSVTMAPGVTVRHIDAGSAGDLRKEDLPSQLCAMSSGLFHIAEREEISYDLVHSHYWLSGHVGWLASERWGVPLVHTMHTMAKVKNQALAEGDSPEPRIRIIGEEQVVATASALVANTVQEAVDLERYYDAPSGRVIVAHPGVDLDTFSPGDGRLAARRRLGIRSDALMLLFVGRIQPLKAPDVLVNAAAELITRDPSLAQRLQVVICGGPSGTGLEHPESLAELAIARGLDVTFVPPQERAVLADYYRAADLVAVPSYSESFGLVAVEAQACGTPVIAAAVGGLRTAVSHNVSGILVEGHDPLLWAERIHEHLTCTVWPGRLSAGAVRHAALFSWDRTVESLLDAYRLARCSAVPVRARVSHG
jgi:D-inositol-3-phosphate glycosyltransferase